MKIGGPSRNVRFSVFSDIADSLLKQKKIKSSGCYLDKALLEKAVTFYWNQLPKLKQEYGITDRIDRYKVAASATIAIYMHTPIKIPKDTRNSFAIFSNHIYAIICGMANLAGNDGLYHSIPPDEQAKLFQQLDKKKAKVISLASQYKLLEKAYNDRPLEIL